MIKELVGLYKKREREREKRENKSPKKRGFLKKL
jgi:hypothetical protein